MRKLLLLGGWALALLVSAPAHAQHGGMGAAFDSTAKDSVLLLDVVLRRVGARNADIESPGSAASPARPSDCGSPSPACRHRSAGSRPSWASSS